MGFEPTTRGLKGRCSTAELWAQILRKRRICNTLDYLFFNPKVNYRMMRCVSPIYAFWGGGASGRPAKSKPN